MKKITDIGWESKEQKKTEKKKRIITCFGDQIRKRYFHYNFLEKDYCSLCESVQQCDISLCIL